MKTLYKLFAITAAMFFAVNATAQLVAPINFPLPSNTSQINITTAEYFIDTDPGMGQGTNITITSGTDITASNIGIPIDTLSTGVHRIYIRAKNAGGVWSMANEANFFIIPQGAVFPANTILTNITAAEWFIDNDPGMGQGTSITITSGIGITASNIAIPIDTLSTGVHHIYVRVKNINGGWSLSNESNFYILQQSALFPANASVANITAAEYFIDTDPGLGQGPNIAIASGADVSANNVAINISSLTIGAHRIYVRSKNANNVWSITNVASFYIVPINFSLPPNSIAGNITAIEYFFDTDPGFGNGTILNITPTTNLSNYQIVADITGLQQDTTHTLYVRALDGWSQTMATTFIIGSVLPVKWILFTGKRQTDNTVLLQWQIATGRNNNRFEIQRSNDAALFETIGVVKADTNAKGLHQYQFIDQQPPLGNNAYRLKQIDNDGQVSFSPILSINIINHTAADTYLLANPVRDNLRVHISKELHKISLQVYNMQGQAILHTTANANGINQVNVSQLASGIYILKIVSTEKELNLKFIKE